MEWKLVWHESAQFVGDTSFLQLTWTLSLAVGGILAGYLLFHVWLLHQGKTTLELITGKPGELEGNSLFHNATVYFGRNVAVWWLPVPPALDGTMRGRRSRRNDRRETQQLVA